MSTTVGGVDIGYVSSEIVKKEAVLTVMPLPLSNSDETDVFDFGGATQRITVTSVLEESLANIRTSVTNLKALISGDQFNTVAYISDGLFPDPGINVKVENVDVTYYGGKVRIADITLTLIEASSRG